VTKNKFWGQPPHQTPPGYVPLMRDIYVAYWVTISFNYSSWQQWWGRCDSLCLQSSNRVVTSWFILYGPVSN